MADIFIARQPIYDRELEVFGYELLYRASEVNQAAPEDGDQATTHVILNAFVEMDLERLVGAHSAFINFPASLLTTELPKQLPHGKVALEILEDVEVTPEIVGAVRELSKQGFTIALDDFVYGSSLRPLIEIADIIKFDLLSFSPEELAKQVRLIRDHKVRIVAEKVESVEQFELCKELGFDYFQGYHFCRPHVIKGQRLPEDRLTVLRLLAELQSSDVEASKLEAIVSRDVSLSYKLIRVVNSAHFYRPHRIHSIHHAIVYLGNRAIKAWLSLIAMSGAEPRPHELTTVAMVRARMCELLAEALGYKNREGYFTAGLFSVLDALLGLPMEEVIGSLHLDDDLEDALLRLQGPYGRVLACTVAYERGDWDDPVCRILAAQPLREAYLAAVAWADSARQELERAA
jgi:EAL and modified HD-GYP domain-containing signal transduction protein